MKRTAANYKSIQLFKNPFLEKFTHVHPLTPLVFWSPVVVYLLWQVFTIYPVAFLPAVGWAIAGILVWTLCEYFLHRYVFHFQGHGMMLNRFHFLIHGFHHLDASDPTRLVMTPIVSVVLGAGFYFFFGLFLEAGPLHVFFAFFLVGYLCYDYIHYYVHFFTPKGRIGKILKQNHMKHHFAEKDVYWGVSSPLWDYIFRSL